MCRRCVIAGCEVLIVGVHDLCSKHFRLLPPTQQKRLDDLAGAAEGTPNWTRYAAELAASVECLERKAVAIKKAMAEATATGAA